MYSTRSSRLFLMRRYIPCFQLNHARSKSRATKTKVAMAWLSRCPSVITWTMLGMSYVEQTHSSLSSNLACSSDRAVSATSTSLLDTLRSVEK